MERLLHLPNKQTFSDVICVSISVFNKHKYAAITQL